MSIESNFKTHTHMYIHTKNLKMIMFLQNLKKMQLNLKLGKISCSTTICERNLVIVNALGKNNDLLFIKMRNNID